MSSRTNKAATSGSRKQSASTSSRKGANTAGSRKAASSVSSVKSPKAASIKSPKAGAANIKSPKAASIKSPKAGKNQTTFKEEETKEVEQLNSVISEEYGISETKVSENFELICGNQSYSLGDYTKRIDAVFETLLKELKQRKKEVIEDSKKKYKSFLEENNNNVKPIYINKDQIIHSINNIYGCDGSDNGIYNHLLLKRELLLCDKLRLLNNKKLELIKLEKNLNESNLITNYKSEINKLELDLSKIENDYNNNKDLCIKSGNELNVNGLKVRGKPPLLLEQSVRACLMLLNKDIKYDDKKQNDWVSISREIKPTFAKALINAANEDDGSNINNTNNDDNEKKEEKPKKSKKNGKKGSENTDNSNKKGNKSDSYIDNKEKVDNIIKLIENKYFGINNNEMSENKKLTMKNVEKACNAAKPLVTWLESIIKYYKLLPNIKKLRIEIYELKLKLNKIDGKDSNKIENDTKLLKTNIENDKRKNIPKLIKNLNDFIINNNNDTQKQKNKKQKIIDAAIKDFKTQRLK